MGMSVVCNNVYRNISVKISEGEMRWNFIPLSISKFDVILGMDGLSYYRANVNCYTRQVEFEKENREKITFVRENKKIPIKIISIMMAMKYLRKGYEAYLTYVIEKKKKGPNLKELLMVNEFEDVFLEDLPSLLPKKEIKFKIELIPGIAPISQAPYRIASAELKELNVQLKELLDKGFIRPSFSSWDSLILFVKKKNGSF